MNVSKKFFCILIVSMVCIALQFMCSINVHAQDTTGDGNTEDSLLVIVPVGWTPEPVDEWTMDTTPSLNPSTPVPAPAVPENSTDSSVKDVSAADSLELTVPVGWTPAPIDEWTIDTTLSSNSATPIPAIDAKIKTPKVKKSKIKNGIITIKWRRVKGASKYQVKIYNEKTGKQVLNRKTKRIYFKSKVADVECSALSVKVRACSKSVKKWSKWSKMKVK